MYSFLKQVARSRAESMNQNEAVWTPKIDVATLAAAYFDFELSLAAEALYSYSLTVKFLWCSLSMLFLTHKIKVTPFYWKRGKRNKKTDKSQKGNWIKHIATTKRLLIRLLMNSAQSKIVHADGTYKIVKKIWSLSTSIKTTRSILTEWPSKLIDLVRSKF